jgi:hypothetical protein
MEVTFLSSVFNKDSTLAMSLSYSGIAINWFFFISPIFLFLEVTKTREVKKIPEYMLICNTLDTCFWVVYGMSGGGTPIWISNSAGLVFSIVYLIWYFILKFDSVKTRILVSIISLIVIFSFVLFGVYCLLYNEQLGMTVKDWFGWIAVIGQLPMFMAPGQKIVSFIFLIENV